MSYFKYEQQVSYLQPYLEKFKTESYLKKYLPVNYVEPAYLPDKSTISINSVDIFNQLKIDEEMKLPEPTPSQNDAFMKYNSEAKEESIPIDDHIDEINPFATVEL
jgi:hypothetical protein